MFQGYIPPEQNLSFHQETHNGYISRGLISHNTSGAINEIWKIVISKLEADSQ